jgi:RNA polymerase sigma-70 factor (ECF subfamily)
MEDDTRILLAFSKGSPVAFEHIYNRFYVRIYIEANRYIRSEEDAKDIRSKCFIKLWELRDKLKFESMGALFSWLRVTVSNSCIDYLRMISVRKLKREEISLYFSEYNDISAFEVSDKEAIILERLLKQIDLLPVNVKVVFKMRWLNDLKFKEIAEALDADISTIKKRYARALTILRKQNLCI